MKKRILSLLLILCMAVTLLPTAVFAEEATGVVVPKGQAKIGDKMYATLDEAMGAVNEGDTATIYLGEGTYSGNAANPTDPGKGAGKNLTFVGAGIGETTWQIQAVKQYDADGWCDYSFKGSDRITFENMTVVGSVYLDDTTKSNNTQGLTYINHITLKDCVFNGRADYWGYESTTFENVTFNAPGTEASGVAGSDYSLWTYTGKEYTFKNCTFNSKFGKIVNVYRHSDTGYDIVVNFEDCTVISSAPNKSVLNIKDSNNNYTINFSGINKVTGLNPNRKTCSRWFQVESVGEGNSHYATVNIDDTTVWQDGKMVSHAIDTDNDKYTDGYKDNAFTTDEGAWTTNPDGTKTRTITKTCDYCGYEEKTTEIDWNVPKSKTATRLDKKTWTSDVTLSLFDGTATVVLPDMPGNQTSGVAYTVGAGSTVTDTIGEKFTFGGVDSFTLKVGTKEIKGVKDDSDENTVNFGEKKDDGKYPYTVTYTPDTKTFVWTINEVLNGRESVQLTYTVKLTKPETAPGTYGVEDLKGEKVLTDTEAANALYTNESAVLNAKTRNNVTIVAQEFPKPSVSYTVHSFVPATTYYYFAVEKVDAQDDHALSGARFGLYLDGKQIAAATSDRSGLVLFCVSESDYRKISANSSLYYQELTAPEGYLVNGDAVSIGKDNLTTSRAVAEKNAVTVRNYRNTVPAMLNGSDHFAYVVGYEDGCVRPNGLISRAETSSIFFRLLKDSVRDSKLLTTNTYADVPSDHWANTAISTMTGLGIVQGYNSTTFDPSAPITRAQFAAICARFDTGKSSGTQTFTDIKGHWAEKYIERAAELGWIKGFEDGTFRPDTYITRAQAMTMINRVLNRIPEDASDLLPDMNVWPDCNPGDWFYLAVQEATNSHNYKHKAGNYETWTGMNKNPDWIRYEH